MIPRAARIAVLINPADAKAESTLRDVDTAASTIGMQIQVARARTAGEIDAAFAGERPDALFLGADPFFTSRRIQLANLASRHAIPMTSATREITDVGGLMSYEATFRMLGVRSAPIRVASSRAPTQRTCRSCR